MPNRWQYRNSSEGPPDPVQGYTWQVVPSSDPRAPYTSSLTLYDLIPNAPTTPGIGTSGGAPSFAEPGVPSLPDYSQISDLIAQINATNQAAQHSANLGRIPGAAGLEAQSSAAIADLFDPDANLPSVNMDAAAAAVGSGTVGSPFAGITGLRRRDDEITRRQALARQMLNAAYAGNPAAPIADTQALVQLLQQQGFTGGQNAAQRALQADLAARERATQLAIAALRNSGSHATNPGGGYYGPRIPTGYGTPGAPASTFRAGIPEFPDYSGGAGTGWLLPSGSVPENFGDLTGAQQMDYANMFANNPYNNIPDVLNPYASEYNPLDPSLAAYYE